MNEFAEKRIREEMKLFFTRNDEILSFLCFFVCLVLIASFLVRANNVNETIFKCYKYTRLFGASSENSRNASGFPVDYPFPDKDNNYCTFVVLIRLPLTEV